MGPLFPALVVGNLDIILVIEIIMAPFIGIHLHKVLYKGFISHFFIV